MPNTPARNVTLLRLPEGAGKGKHGTKYRLTFRDENGNERHANTRGGTLLEMLMAVQPGDRLNLMRDGRGSVIGMAFAKNIEEKN